MSDREEKTAEDKKKRRTRSLPRMQLLAFVVLALVAAFAFTHKVGAQPTAQPKGTGAPKLAPKPPPKEDPKKPGEKKDDKIGDKPTVGGGDEHKDEKKEEEKKDEKKKDEPDLAQQLKTAELGPNGGVPTHKKGDFKSPFADPDRQRVDVKVGFLLENVDEYDIKKGAFTAHFYVSLTSPKPMPPEVSIHSTNGKLDAKELLADYPTFKLWKMVGTFNNKPDLHAYPFDTQELLIELEDDSTGTDSMRLVPDLDHSFLDAGFEVAGWDLAYMRARVLNHYYPDRFDDDDLYYSRYKFTLGIKRFATSAIFTVFMPALVIVLISLSGLWFPREELEVRSNATTPMLAAAVLFHFALMQELPATAYLSRADKLMMAVYGCLFLHMLSSWIWFAVDERHTEFLFRAAKWFCAPLTFAIMACGILL